MKKVLCMLLCLVMLLGVLVSCGGEEPKETEGTTENGSSDVEDVTTPGGEETKGEETETPLKEIVLEDFSKDGTPRDLFMMVRENRHHYLWVEKDTTNKVEHETYVRNRTIEENFGIKINNVEIGGGSSSQQWVTTLSSGAPYDLGVPDFWWLLEQQGLFMDLSTRKELDFNQPYWYDGWNDNVTINGRIYMVAGDATLEILENIEIVFFNKDMTDTLGLDMYKVVMDGEWTIDKMLTINKSLAMNLDDNDEENNVYGSMYDTHSLQAQLYAADLKLTNITDDGRISLIAESRAKNVDIQEKVKELIHSNTNKYWGSTARSDVGKKATMLNTGKAAFYATAMYCGSTIKNQTTVCNYGVIPMPKFDEEGDYISTSYGVSLFGIPKAATDPHFSAVIMDAMNYYSNDTIVKGFFDSTMKAQVADSAYDARMMDIARNNLYFDFAWILQQGGTMTVHSAFNSATVNADKDLASLLAPAMEVSTEGLAKLIEFYNQ